MEELKRWVKVSGGESFVKLDGKRPRVYATKEKTYDAFLRMDYHQLVAAIADTEIRIDDLENDLDALAGDKEKLQKKIALW